MQAVATTRLDECEEAIARGMRSFVEVGRALAEIRDQRLYLEVDQTFEGYCRKRWSIGRTYAHRLIEAARVVDVLLPMGNIPPANERQARILAALPDEATQAAVWARAVETAPRNEAGEPVVSAAHVRRVAMESTGAGDTPAATDEAMSPQLALQFRLGLMLELMNGWVEEIVAEEPNARLALAEQFEKLARQLRTEAE